MAARKTRTSSEASVPSGLRSARARRAGARGLRARPACLRLARLRSLASALAILITLAPPALALRIVSYNLLNYPGSTGSARAAHFRAILEPIGADVVVCQEVHAAGPNQFLNEVLQVLEPGQWETVPFIDGNDSDATIFYRSARVDTVWQWAFYPNPANPLRLVHVYRLKLAGYPFPASELRIYTAHLKASTGYETQRLLECTGLRDSMNAMPPGTRALLCGDLNFYRESTEPGYWKLLENQSNNNGRLFDLLPAGDWHDHPSFAPFHTQSPCKDGTCASGAATGGLDDRFDFILPTGSLLGEQGMGVIANTCRAVGNDGQHLNLNITDPPAIPEGAAYAQALKLASDHLPLVIDLRLPARLSVEPQLAFDPVIAGAPLQTRELAIANPAIPPADSLDCVLTAPVGFGSPASLAVAAGASTSVTLAMSAEVAGTKEGDLVLATDAPEAPTATVALAGTVLRHAAASLDSLSLVTADTLDFGDHSSGEFDPRFLRVHNAGYDPLQARLALLAAEIAGGSGRFSLVEEFSPGLLAGTSCRLSLAFDAAGATVDSTYWETLTIASADEPLPGAGPQPDLLVTLRACVTAGASSAPAPAARLATRLHPATPNPLAGRTSLLLELAESGLVRLTVFDASGRLVRTLWDGPLRAGRHPFLWDSRDDRGALAGSGVYFVRAVAPGTVEATARLVVVR